MPVGPGIYDDECTSIRLATNARGVLLIVIGGNKGERGDGFSCQADLDTTLRLPEILEMVAKEIRASMKRGTI